jgi:tetratricopeptide (TPR) repeat protein
MKRLLLVALATAGCAGAPPPAPAPDDAAGWPRYAVACPSSFVAQIYAGYAALQSGDDAAFDACVARAEQCEHDGASLGALVLEGARRSRDARRVALFDRAVRHLAGARRRAPDDRDTAMALGAALLESGRAADAVAHLEFAASVRPLDRRPLRLLARAWLAQDDPIRALDAVKRQDATAPLDADDHDVAGACHHHLGQFEQAVAAYRKAIEGDRERAGTWNNLGLALKELGRAGEADRCLAESRRLRSAASR